ncbi:MAG: 50S ribosomal protein L29 [Chloroflexota bacterium]
MKKRERQELREQSAEELRRRQQDAKQELFNLRFQLATRSLTNYERMNQVRRQIARLNTLLRERELGVR